ncbi:uncharacterized protein RCC_10844 [Ramularia collo-cygni]|uniref:Zn(2)-C6 fungal-type domain-containing protein n=1 Tax=Ramularia collo-cygni TaxID=112498 RepID=A0A2D3VGJ3_9PEZI|nr:uncharacterized protein RCC_10844 [Ramularia collo-cygni]CZT25115.1 uncharacterized protein RCC_10844 [Ramularia collo-cygni]
MSSSRVSFGSRAGTAFDRPGGIGIRSSIGAYDTLDALAEALRTENAAATEGDEPQCTTLELCLSAGAVLELVRPGVGPYADGGEQDLPLEFKQMQAVENGLEHNNDESGIPSRLQTPRASIGHIVNVADAQQAAIVQRAASRGVMQAIEAADGFRYSFNNAWNAKDGEGSRFSYICQDSMQNKDRHANGYPRTIKHLKGDVGSRGPRKPTYDCKGSVSIKFSTSKQRCDVYYRHYAIHPTVAERAQMPRAPAVRRPFVSRGALLPQVVDSSLVAEPSGGLLATLQAENYASSALAMVDRPESSNIGRPLKRKRESAPPLPRSPPVPRSPPDKPLSLMELLSQSESAKTPAVGELSSRQDPSHMPAPIAYDLPSWQIPPPPLNNRQQNGANIGYPAPYQPPYPPSKNHTPSTHIAAPTQLQQAQTQHKPPFKQKVSGQPAGSHPKAQGLFTTLKPVGNSAPAGLPVTTYAPTATMYQGEGQSPAITTGYELMQRQRRARTSCERCRSGKRKCDEGQPCTACIKGGLGALDCVYEGAAPYDTDPTSFTPGGNRLPWTAHEKPSGTPAYSQASAGTLADHLPWATPVSQRPSDSTASPTVRRPPVNSCTSAERASSPDPWFPKR